MVVDFGEVVLDWIDIPIGSPLFEDAQGMVHTTKWEYSTLRCLMLFVVMRKGKDGVILRT